ncbi:MAG: hypothetical protein ACTMHL_05700 [Janibacter sp.]
MSYPPSGPHVPPPTGPGPAPKKGLSGGIIAGIIGVAVLVVAVCCMGGFFVYQTIDDESESPSTSETIEDPPEETTSETSEETTTEEPTDEPTSETSTPSDSSSSSSSSSSPTGTSVDFPGSYDGWTNSAPSSTTLASYSKDGDRFSVIASSYLKPSNYEQLWDSSTKYGEVSCGRRSSEGSDIYCTAEKDGSTFLATSPDLDEEQLASAMQGMLDEL